ncbi:5'-nucleotidase [Paraconexibacter sp. AEG42_29]|uniref:5'-nucleotidase n=1 Tax=Paraconexibacter sp. AEG42_29 TaxID=2997339 RepID=A0AAU7ASQ0_9ACTN
MPGRTLAPAVLLDLDGTLVDSRAAIVAGVNQTLAALGAAERPAESLHPFIGPPLHTTFATLLGRHPDDTELDAIVADYRRRYGDLMLDHTPVFDGVPEALDKLVDAGCVLVVATSKARPLAQRLVEGLGLGRRLTAVCGPVPPARDDKATTVGHALEAVGGPARAVMVGDRHHDVDGARVHGLACVGVLWGIGDADELTDAGAASLCRTPQDLADAALALL